MSRRIRSQGPRQIKEAQFIMFRPFLYEKWSNNIHISTRLNQLKRRFTLSIRKLVKYGLYTSRRGLEPPPGSEGWTDQLCGGQRRGGLHICTYNPGPPFRPTSAKPRIASKVEVF